MTTPDVAPTVVIGVGNPMRGDDGIGPAAIAHLERSDLAGSDLVVLDGEPARLIETWSDRHRVIVIDAARSGAAAGSIHRIEVGVDPLPTWAAGSSSHSAGIVEAVALGRALERLPPQLIVFGVEAGDVSLGDGLSDELKAVLPTLVERVLAEAGR